ncbi:phosphatase PAP2 family protein [Paenibacillus cellulositrophicus]|uniref:phosphatase PAP2 family protein n=1 Tax=Paenibacillus cellulositrophicus TaxID=562959 RepID=UPI00203B934B|nr:phosphatase PAP2 family protein [Paenibacillus cellulositrophicus]MCM2997254.1 phosphatase PAP2 family protein [Paenibacillus cellulositrophicus]
MRANQGRLNKLLVMSLVLGVLFVIMMVLVGADRIAWFDQSIINAVQGMENEGLTRIMKGFTFLGSSLVATLLSVIAFLFLWLVLRHRKELLMFLLSVGGSEIWNIIIKNWMQRQRPNTHRLIEISGFSFPSGHSMAAFALYGTLTYLLWRHIPSLAGRIAMIVIGVALTLLIGISRIYLGVHYPSDVFGGYLASATWLMLSIYIFEKYWKPRT